MNLQTLIGKFKTYPVASTAAFVSIILILAIYVRGMGISDLEERHDDARREWRRIDVNVKNSVNLETHLENAKAASQDVRERLIHPSQLALNYQYFYRLETSTGVRISIQQQETKPLGLSGDDDEDAEALFSDVEYTMSANGQFSELLGFYHALENGRHFYQLNQFSLQRPSETEGREVELTMNFSLLGRP